jgi:hypothetical protein
MLARFKKLIFKNDDVQRFQEEVSKTFNQITDIKILDGAFLKASLKSGDNEIDHKLSRALSGVILIKKNAPGGYYIKSITDKKIILNADAAFDAEFWVF